MRNSIDINHSLRGRGIFYIDSFKDIKPPKSMNDAEFIRMAEAYLLMNKEGYTFMKYEPEPVDAYSDVIRYAQDDILLKFADQLIDELNEAIKVKDPEIDLRAGRVTISLSKDLGCDALIEIMPVKVDLNEKLLTYTITQIKLKVRVEMMYTDIIINTDTEDFSAVVWPIAGMVDNK